MRIIADLDEFAGLVDQEVAVSDWFEVSQERINRFADATNDWQWIHLDAERAQRESPFKSTIAHGFLTLSLLTHLFEQSVRIDGQRFIVNYGVNRVRFPRPVTAGSRIRARFTVAGFTPQPSGGEVEWLVTVEREHERKAACIANLVIRCYT